MLTEKPLVPEVVGVQQAEHDKRNPSNQEEGTVGVLRAEGKQGNYERYSPALEQERVTGHSRKRSFLGYTGCRIPPPAGALEKSPLGPSKRRGVTKGAMPTRPLLQPVHELDSQAAGTAARRAARPYRAARRRPSSRSLNRQAPRS